MLDPYARYIFAKETGQERLVSATEAYFLTQECMKEGNPQTILKQGEKALLPHTLILQGLADNNLPLSLPKRFVESYRAAGGDIEIEYFPDMPHAFGINPSPETDRALEFIKTFIARQFVLARVS